MISDVECRELFGPDYSADGNSECCVPVSPYKPRRCRLVPTRGQPLRARVGPMTPMAPTQSIFSDAWNWLRGQADEWVQEQLGGQGPIAQCGAGWHRDQFGNCVPNSAFNPQTGTGNGPDYTPGVVTPAEQTSLFPQATGFPAPQRVNVPTFKCPKINGKRGIVHYSPQTGMFACLPRGVNGAPFGLVRKNKRRPKPFMTAAEIKALKKRDGAAKKAKELARLTGQVCRPRGRGR